MATKTIYGAGAISIGTGAGDVPVLDNSGKLPAVDGSQLTGVSGGVTENLFRRVDHTTGTSTFGADMQTLINASSAGDVVEMVVGTQQDQTITLKNGVNLRYLAGTTIALSTGISAFTDNGAAVTCLIDGGLPNVTATAGSLFTLSNAATKVTASMGVVTGTSLTSCIADLSGGAQLTLSIAGQSRWMHGNWCQLASGAKFYFTFNELEVGDNAYIADALEFWPTGRKLFGNTSYGLINQTNVGGTPLTHGKIDQIIGTGGIDLYPWNSLITCRSGNLIMESDVIQNSGDSVFTGDWEGNVTIKGARIISTRNHADYGVAIRFRSPGGTPGKFTLDNCTVISSGASATESINGTGNLYVNGPVVANKDKAATVTVKGGSFSFSSDVS